MISWPVLRPPSRRVAESDPDGVAVARQEATHAVPEVDAVGAPSTPVWTTADEKDHAVLRRRGTTSARDCVRRPAGLVLVMILAFSPLLPRSPRRFSGIRRDSCSI